MNVLHYAPVVAIQGWTPKRFAKKLENVCDKLSAAGVRGGPAGMAANRRRHLVEYAVSRRLVTPDDLPILDGLLDPSTY